MKTNARRKFIATLLALSLILTGFPGTAVWAQSGSTDQTEEQAAAVSSEQPVSQAQPVQEPEVFQLDADCKLLNYVHAEVFAQNNHVARLKEEETLSSYVFQNRDGSRTVYFLDDNVKFVDADGITKEKDITLVSAKGGYSTRQNNIKLLLPSDPASGIRMEYDGHTVTLIPQGGSLRAAPQLVNNSVRYSGYFGENTSLNYTPTLDGLKEDIVLSAYAGVNAFTFTMNTGGLNLYQAGEKYYLAESKLAVERIQLNEIEVYDANLKPCRGTLTVKTVMPGQRYDITVSVSEEYLTDPTTAYPVTIDPSLTISDADGSGSILDAPIYEGYPNSNFGSYIFNRAGYAGSDYGIGRTVVRLDGLLFNFGYAECEGADVESVKFYMAEADGASPRTVRLYPLTTNYSWTESNITWNNVGTPTVSSWASASMSYGNYACFDITELAREWKSGSLFAYCGFLLKGANESSVDTVMLSSEYSSKMPYVVASYWSEEVTPDPTLSINPSTATMYIGDTLSVSADITPSSAQVAWSSSNSSVASVSGGTVGGTVTGTITAKKVGQATIYVTANGITKACYVTVRIPNGVYYIDNVSTELRLGTSGSIAEGTDATLQYATTADPARVFQLWKITHLENGVCYSVRPLNKKSMGLTSQNTAAEIREIGLGENPTEMQGYEKWYISGNWTEGFLFKANNSSTKYLQPDGDFASVGTSVITDSYDDLSVDIDKYYWDLTPVTGVSGAVLYENDLPITHATRYIAKGSSKTLDDWNLWLSVFSTGSQPPDFAISTGDAPLSYNAETGAITAYSAGSYTVSGVSPYNNISLTIIVNPISEGAHYIRHGGSGFYLDYNSDDSGSLFQKELNPDTTQKWVFSHRDDGTYSISPENISSGSFVGISGSGTSSGQMVVRQSSEMFWKIETNTELPGTYVLIKTTDSDGNDLVAATESDDAYNGANIYLNMYNANDQKYDEAWMIFEYHPLILNVRYDKAFRDRFGGSDAEAVAAINTQLAAMKTHFEDEYGISIDYTDPVFMLSYADDCTERDRFGYCVCGICFNTKDRSSPAIYHHTNLSNVLARIPSPNADAANPSAATVLFTGNKICQENMSHNELHDFRGLANYIDCVLGVNVLDTDENAGTANGYIEDIRVLVHEVGHMFLIKDHYNDTGENSTKGMNAKYDCSWYSDDCIYGQNKRAAQIQENLTTCEGCQRTIRQNANRFQ